MITVLLLVIIAVLLVGAFAESRFESIEMILNIHQFQNLVRSCANSNIYHEGEDDSLESLQSSRVGADKYLEDVPLGPSKGINSFEGKAISSPGVPSPCPVRSWHPGSMSRTPAVVGQGARSMG